MKICNFKCVITEGKLHSSAALGRGADLSFLNLQLSNPKQGA